ncbi:protein-tyrosine phosphatase-like protein [Myxozyma melibiosi]|uniref:Protein-tyrosine phosphatase-like protein n=1 Tax=Myxozyma melibiosi TaxID=54550 RepID=A0ABR1EYJ6_9ASCO
MDYTESRVEIPVSASSSPPNSLIIGTLTTPSTPSYPSSVVVVAHGFSGHKDYIYHRVLASKLASKLGVYCLRFDFRDCGDSAEIETEEKRVLEEDYSDLKDVLAYARQQLKLFVLASVGHSRGAIATLTYSVLYDPTIPHLINCSGRYTSHDIVERTNMMSSTWQEDNGLYFKCLRHGSVSKRWFAAAETHSLSTVDMSMLARLLPPAHDTDFLTIFGLADELIAVTDAACYANLLAGAHTLKLIPEVGHNFYAIAADGTKLANKNPEVADTIVDFLSPERIRERFVKRNLFMGETRRWKTVDGVLNFRDLGGWKVKSATTAAAAPRVRTGFIYRAAALSTITPTGVDAAKELGLRKSIDLRSTVECHKGGIYAVPGMERVHLPLGKNEDMSPAEIAKKLSSLDVSDEEGFVAVYKDFLDQGVRSYKYVFDHIKDEPQAPIVIHCTAGKDRTGVICALILLLAGVDHDTIAREYELTTHGLAAEYEKILAGLDGSLPPGAEEGTRNQILERIMSSRYETMRKMLDVIDDEFGGVEGYLSTHLSFSPADIATIKRNLLTDADASAKANL